PEFPDVVQAMASYFQAIGLRPRLVPMEVATLVDKQRSRGFNNTLESNRQSIQPLFYYVPAEYGSTRLIHCFEASYTDDQIKAFSASVDPAVRLDALKNIGNFLHDNYATLPLLFLYAEVGVNPNVVADFQADIAAFGAGVDQEYTKAVR